MSKIITLLVFGILLLNVQCTLAKEKDTLAKPSNTSYTYEDTDEQFDFSENSYYVSDEQLKDAEEISDIDDHSDFDCKVINSSHFSSGTATRTWIPINRVK